MLLVHLFQPYFKKMFWNKKFLLEQNVFYEFYKQTIYIQQIFIDTFGLFMGKT